MACYHPIKGYKIFNEKTGKYEIKISYSLHYEDMVGAKEVELPCGKCIGCRLARSAEWAMRCQLECKYYLYNYFVTLTYDDAHLPIRNHCVVDKETGEVTSSVDKAILMPEHMTKFMKDLRRYYSYHYSHTGIRFFLAGEYGGKTKRPHYHLILFNLPIYDLKLYKQSFNGNNLYNSAILSSIWNRGHVVIGEVTYESCAYVARYTTKKVGLNKADYEEQGLVPEFVRMSLKPGIGFKYFEENQDKIKKNDNILLKRGDKVVSFKPSRYFDNHFYTNEELESVKMKRMEFAELGSDLEMLNTDLPREDYLLSKEFNKKQSFNSIRGDCED